MITKVLISVPNLHWIHKFVVHKLLLLQKDGRYATTVVMTSHKPFENNLHHLVNEFLEGDYNFWLSMDDDNPPINNPLDLVALNKDIIGLPTPIWYYNPAEGRDDKAIYWNAYDYDESNDKYREHPIKKGLQRVDSIGTGCFLMARRVFEDPEMQKGAFTRKLYPDGTVHKGNDMSFCERARERGFEIYAHYDYPCQHFCSNIELGEVQKAFRGGWE